MPKMDERVQIISSSILTQAEQESKAIIASANQLREAELTACEEEVIQTMFNMVQRRSGQIRLAAVRGISDTQVKATQQLLRRREELTATVFAAVKTRLFEFAGTTAYTDQFFAQLQDAKGEWDHTGTSVLVREADLSLSARIQKVLPGCKVEMDSSIKIGGWKLLNRKAGILIDSTLDAKLEEQRPWFLSHCGLQVAE